MKSVTPVPSRPVALLLAALLAGGAMTQPVAAAEKTSIEMTGLHRYRDRGDPAMVEIAVNSGRALVSHLESARVLLAQERIAQAHSALIASREFAAAIARAMPYLTLVEEMKETSDRLVQENTDMLTTDLLPIYASLDALAVYAPGVAHRIRGRVKQVEKHAADGDRQAAARELKQAADGIASQTVYLPVTYVERQIRVALNEVNQPTPAVLSAKAAIERALDRLTTVLDAVVETPGAS